jgi:hypothetical protein
VLFSPRCEHLTLFQGSRPCLACVGASQPPGEVPISGVAALPLPPSVCATQPPPAARPPSHPEVQTSGAGGGRCRPRYYESQRRSAASRASGRRLPCQADDPAQRAALVRGGIGRGREDQNQTTLQPRAPRPCRTQLAGPSAASAPSFPGSRRRRPRPGHPSQTPLRIRNRLAAHLPPNYSARTVADRRTPCRAAVASSMTGWRSTRTVSSPRRRRRHRRRADPRRPRPARSRQ